MAGKMKSAPLDAQLAERLLDLLSTDDGYRARFKDDPRTALSEIGYCPPAPARMTADGTMPIAPPEALIDCRVENLASKEAILAARDDIKKMLLQGLAQQTPQLDTGLATAFKLVK